MPFAIAPFAGLLNRPIGQTRLPAIARVKESRSFSDATVSDRIIAMYRAADRLREPTASFWDAGLRELKGAIHSALLTASPDQVRKMLDAPSSQVLQWGFDTTALAPPGHIEPHEWTMRQLSGEENWESLYAAWISDGLASLADAVGASRVRNPEAPPSVDQRDGWMTDIDALLDAIQVKIGMELDFPNPFTGEPGLASSRGIVGFRAVQAIYQAWRIVQLTRERSNVRVLEIGAGLGRTAYYAAKMGIGDYTIIDIPMTNVAQAHFLAAALGPDRLSLMGEPSEKGAIRVIPDFMLPAISGEYFDVVVNVDSLSEMDYESAERYYRFCKSNAAMLLSINHELNSMTTRTFYEKDISARTSRYPYWLRKGYVEELIQWQN